MLFQTHILIGVLFFLLIKDFFTGGNQVIFFMLILLGSILPDIDEKNSKINRWFGIFGTFIAFFAKHRGFFHSLTFHVILFLIISAITKTYYASALLLGYFAHLIGDGITPMGIKVFYPFSDFKVRGPIRTGGFFEGIILIVLAIIIVTKII